MTVTREFKLLGEQKSPPKHLELLTVAVSSINSKIIFNNSQHEIWIKNWKIKSTEFSSSSFMKRILAKKNKCINPQILLCPGN